jgi:hypothetical protein
MIKSEHKHSVLTGNVIGCAMTVHSALGNGFQEVIYQRALAIEMADQRIVFSREHEMPIYYRGQQIGTRRVDFLVALIGNRRRTESCMKSIFWRCWLPESSR